MRGRCEENTLSPLKLRGAAPPGRRDPGAAAARDGLGGAGGEAPPGPGSPSPPQGQTPRHGPAHGPNRSASPRDRGPPYPAPSRPLALGRFPCKGPAGEVRFWVGNFLPIGCWKTKGFCEAETSGRGFNAPPPFFSKRNHPNLRQNSADIFAVLRISFFNKCGNRRHRDYSFFYEGENLIFRDFVGGVSRPRLPVAGRRGAGSLRRRPGAGSRGSSAGNRPLEEFNLPL